MNAAVVDADVAADTEWDADVGDAAAVDDAGDAAAARVLILL